MKRFRDAKKIIVWMAASLICMSMQTRADVVRDGSIGSGPLRLEGPDFVIPQAYGETHGGNLFHSFETFNVNRDQSATFEGSAGIERILSRVTGPGGSYIDGLLRSMIPGADLYLMNPDGVVFGPNAQLDIPGSLHVGSADYLRLGESDRFFADLGQTSTLTTAAPEAFGFLGAPVAGVAVKGSRLAVPSGESISLIGKDVLISGGASGWITAPGGRIGLVGVASSGEVVLQASDATSAPDVSSFSSLGDVFTSGLVLLNVAAGGGEAAGQIFVRGRDLTAGEGTFLFADDGAGFFYGTNTGSPMGGEAGGLIDIDLQGTATVSGPYTVMDTQAASAGTIRIHAAEIVIQDADVVTAVQEAGVGGGIDLAANGTIHLKDGAFLSSKNNAIGLEESEGGPIALTGQQIVIEGDSDVYSSNRGNGRGASISLAAARIAILDFGGVQTSCDGPFALPGGGDISLTATDSMVLDKDAIVGTDTEGGGDGGGITINAGSVSLSNESLVQANSGDSGLAFLMLGVTGRAGDIAVTADELSIRSGSRLSNYAEWYGDCGDIDITATDSVLVSGSGPNLNSQIGTYIFSGIGSAGDVRISVPSGSVAIEDGARIIARAAQGASSASGNIDIAAREIQMNSATIGTEGNADGGSGDIQIHVADRLTAIASRIGTSYLNGGSEASHSGDITISAETVELSDDSWVSSTSDTGDAGDISIRDAQDITIDKSSVVSTTLGIGRAGDINLTANTIEVNQGNVEAVTNGLGNSGNIAVIAGRLTVLNGGSISNSSQILGKTADGRIIGSPGEGGLIDIVTTESVELVGTDESGYKSSILNANVDGTGEDRRIAIQTPLLVLDQGQIRGNTLGSGKAANVELAVNQLELRNGGNIGTETSPGFTLSSGVTFPESTGDGGDIHVRASTSVLLNGIQNQDDATGIGSSTSGQGVAGDIIIDSPHIEIRQAGISAMTCSDGNAGTVHLICDNLYLTENGLIDLSSTSSGGEAESIGSTNGKGGSLKITASESLDISASVIAAITYTNGDAGEVSIDANNVDIRDSSVVSSLTGATGAGRNIEIRANNFRMTGDSVITTRSKATSDDLRKAAVDNLLPGDAGSIVLKLNGSGEISASAISAAAVEAGGGEIHIEGGRFFSMLGSRIETDVTGGARDGGNVTMTHDQMLLNRSNIIARADQGFGGDITLSAAELVTSADTVIDASSNAGLDGTVTLAAPDVDLESGLAQLPTDYLDASALLRPSCQVRAGDDAVGSFVVVRRKGLPTSPEGLLLAFDANRQFGAPSIAAGVIPGTASGALMASAEGMAAFRGGDFDRARRRLVEAAEMCGDDPACRFDTLRGVAQSQQAMGRYADSVDILQQALNIAQSSGDDRRTASALGNLGNAHIALGQPDIAARLLNRGIAIAKASDDLSLVAGMLNNQGNHHAVQEDYLAALDAYLQGAAAAAEAGDRLLEVQSLANAGRAALEAARCPRAADLLQQANTKVRALPDGNAKVYVLIHLAKSWERLAAASPDQLTENLLLAHDALQAAIDLCRSANNDRALSYAMGNMGALYRREHRTAEALYLTRQALQAAERADAAESLYRWHWQEGKLLWDQGHATAAIHAYQRAVAILEETRQETACQYGSSGVYFRRTVAPVYLDLADALLQGAGRSRGAEDATVLLLEARRTVEKLKAAELRDYFRDECIVDLEARTSSLEAIAGRAAIVYPIKFENRLELLVSLPSGLSHFAVPVPGKKLDAMVRRFRRALLDLEDKRRQYLDASKQLYDWLVRPYVSWLQQEQIDTLVFVPSGLLGTIPVAALHDGKDFIIASYALAVTPGLSLVDPKALASEAPNVLLAGISEPLHGFKALPCVPRELDAIHRLFGGKVMLNDAFRSTSLERELSQNHPAVVHIASHAVFAGDARESYLLAYDDRIDMDQLAAIIGTTRFRRDPIELLMLSACETAAGDARAALGLSGVAIRAGARSAVGSLWPIADEAALRLVTDFYNQLKKGTVSKAEALRQAQLELLGSEKFAHPFFWSPYLMINNWL